MRRLEMGFNSTIISLLTILTLASSGYGQIYSPFKELKGPVKSFDESTYQYNDGIASEQSHDYHIYTLLDSNLQYDHIYFNYYGWIIEKINVDESGKKLNATIYESASIDYALNDLDFTGYMEWQNNNTICHYVETNKSKDTVEYIVYEIDSTTKKIDKATTEAGSMKGTVKAYHYKDTVKRTSVAQRGAYGIENYTTIETFDSNRNLIKTETISHGKMYISEFTYTYDKHGNWTRMECVSSSMMLNSKSQVAKDKRKAYFVERSINYFQ